MNPSRIPLLIAAFAAAVLLALVWFSGGLTLPERRGSSSDAAEPAPPSVALSDPGPGHTVLLVSLDGFRGDYLEGGDAPRMQALREQAAWSRELIPPFPSLTFPSHLTLATGRTAEGHGIPSNTFFDEALGRELRFPGDPGLLRAEPIWTTAARQGLRVLSYDWPLSHAQRGPYATEYFEESFDSSLKDPERVGRVLDLWEQDPRRGEGDPPLRLITAYAKETDSVAHRHGPGTPEVRDAVSETDALVAETVERAARIFDAAREGDEQLYLVFAADHGMVAVTHHVNIETAVGEKLAAKLHLVTSGNLAGIHLRDPEAVDAAQTLETVDQAFAGLENARVFTQENLPPSWNYGPRSRIGDRIVVLAGGYSFDRSSPRPVNPVPPEGGRGLRGMHGYDPWEVPEMAGALFILRHPDPLPHPGDLGRIESLQVHATLCRLLGIEPAVGADSRIF